MSNACWSFFFSSRRRNTRFKCDWSSDVCSSDLLKKWLLRAPPNVGARVSAIPKLLSLGRDMAGLSLAETRIVHDFAVRSAADILDRHFEGDLTKTLFGFDGVVGNFASPQSPGTAYVLLHHLFGEAAGVPRACG